MSLKKLLLLIELEGLLALGVLFLIPSEAGSHMLFGLSSSRLMLVLLIITLLLVNGFLVIFSTRKSFVKQYAAALADHPQTLLLLFFALIFLFLSVLLLLEWRITPELTVRAEMLPVVFDRALPLLLWLGVAAIQLAWFIYHAFRCSLFDIWPQGKWLVWTLFFGWLILLITAGYSAVLLSRIEHFHAPVQLALAGWVVLFFFSGLYGWLRYRFHATPRREAIQHYYTLLLIFLIALAMYKVTSVAVGRVNTPSKSYFDQLAYAFLDGKLYLEAPSSTMDLTLYNGQWYVAFPPLAALLMVPFAWFLGNSGVNTVTFSLFFAAANVALAYEMVYLLSRRKWIELHGKDLIWMALLVGLGSIHWYMAVVGRVWYISRLLSLTFMLFATILTLRGRSPWWIGLAMGLAALARPNMVLIWPMLLGIQWQILSDEGRFSPTRLTAWAAPTVMPVLAAMGGLLYYNWLRFGNWFDFGYATMNVGVNNATLARYGQFNPAFIAFNLRSMWLDLPYYSADCFNHWVPNPQGISLLLTTPALVYLLKPIKSKIWVIGAWSALLIQVALLSMHTGYAEEFGYRFFMDFVIPCLALMALGAGQKVSRLMQSLIMAGVIVNLWGVLWIFGLWCGY